MKLKLDNKYYVPMALGLKKKEFRRYDKRVANLKLMDKIKFINNDNKAQEIKSVYGIRLLTALEVNYTYLDNHSEEAEEVKIDYYALKEIWPDLSSGDLIVEIDLGERWT